MSVILRFTAVLVFLAGTFVLSGDSCRNSLRLDSLAQAGITPPVNWYQAARQGHETSLDSLTSWSAKRSDVHWLQLSAELGDARAFHHLALLSQDAGTQKDFFQQAAQLGFAPSQYELSLSLATSSAQLYWLRRAAEGEYTPAVIGMYHWHLLKDELQQARPWLELAAKVDGESAMTLARQLWREGEQTDSRALFARAAELGAYEAQNYLFHIETFWQKSLKQSLGEHNFEVRNEQCAISLQFVANSLEGIVQATHFQEQFLNDDRLRQLPICMNSPVWIENARLACNPDWHGSNRLACDQAPLAELMQAVDASHLVVFAEEGKANVHNGIMYLDWADTYAVFVHELAHFAGFVDEYPLSSSLASHFCNDFDAPNLVFQQSPEQPLFELNLAKWRAHEGTEGIQLARARTCNNHPAQAYKPDSEMTFMEFFDHPYIPPLYLALWEQRLTSRQGVVPAAENFAQYYTEAGLHAQALMWRRRADLFYQERLSVAPASALNQQAGN